MSRTFLSGAPCISSQRIEKLLRGDKVPTSIIFALILRLHTPANIPIPPVESVFYLECYCWIMWLNVTSKSRFSLQSVVHRTLLMHISQGRFLRIVYFASFSSSVSLIVSDARFYEFSGLTPITDDFCRVSFLHFRFFSFWRTSLCTSEITAFYHVRSMVSLRDLLHIFLTAVIFGARLYIGRIPFGDHVRH